MYKGRGAAPRKVLENFKNGMYPMLLKVSVAVNSFLAEILMYDVMATAQSHTGVAKIRHF